LVFNSLLDSFVLVHFSVALLNWDVLSNSVGIDDWLVISSVLNNVIVGILFIVSDLLDLLNWLPFGVLSLVWNLFDSASGLLGSLYL